MSRVPAWMQELDADPEHAAQMALAKLEGELWSWVRSVMSQGADIRCDYDQGVHKGYEAYSARLDAAAAERSQELFARLNAPSFRAALQPESGRKS